ncbi:hypothetical protein LJK87_19600 [Paenibacillus sp. P25]|nr:hypothetical protein LJK87_19600 [Paenibacillus sp. P25]
MYYFKNDRTFNFENSAVKSGFAPEQLPLLAQYYGITYYGPHISNNRFDNQYVLSALRKVDLPLRDDVYIYIESGFHLTQSILSNDQPGNATSHLILDNDGRIAYSEVPDAFPRDSHFPGFSGGDKSGKQHGYLWFRETSNQGWSVVSVIPTADYNKEMNRWLVQMLLVALLLLGFSLLLAWSLWKMVYRPLNKFNKEIKAAGAERDSAPARENENSRIR